MPDIDLGDQQGKLRIFATPDYESADPVPDSFSLIWWLDPSEELFYWDESKKPHRAGDLSARFDTATLTAIRDEINRVIEEQNDA